MYLPPLQCMLTVSSLSDEITNSYHILVTMHQILLRDTNLRDLNAEISQFLDLCLNDIRGDNVASDLRGLNLTRTKEGAGPRREAYRALAAW